MSRSERIAQQLGMSHGTAASRLRKMILFRQLKKHEENICVKCGVLIEVVEDLSIEHIKPWENRSPELFWDLDNVAFSHVRCNKPHVRNTMPGADAVRKVAPEGQSWCRTHKKFLPIESFSKRPSRWNGVRHDCKECAKKYQDFYRYGKVSEDSADGLQTVSNTAPPRKG